MMWHNARAYLLSFVLYIEVLASDVFTEDRRIGCAVQGLRFAVSGVGLRS